MSNVSRCLGSWIRTLPMVACLGAMGIAPTASAAEGAGSAFGESVDVAASVVLVGSASVQSGPLPAVAGSDQNPFGPVEEITASVSLDLLGAPLLRTGILSAQTGYQGIPSGAASVASVDDLSINLQLTPLVPLASVLADEVVAEAAVSGECGALQASGATTLANARLVALGGGVVALEASPAPNSFIDVSAALGLANAGVGLHLNEQVIGGDGVTSRSMAVTAIRLVLDVNVLNALTLQGEIVIGHAEAAVDCATADLALQKLATPSPVVVDEPLEYRLIVFNAGPDPARNVTLSDTLDLTLQLQNVDSGDATCEADGQDILCHWTSIPSGASQEVVITVLPAATGSVLNTAIVRTEDFDPNDEDNEATVIVDVVDPADPSADLSVQLALVPDSITVSSTAILRATLENLGPSTATGISLDLDVPPNFSVLQLEVGGDGACQGTMPVVCTWDTRAPQSVTTVEAVLRAETPGMVSISAAVTSTSPDPDLGNNSDTISAEVTAPSGLPEADLEVSKRAVPTRGLVGEPLFYIIDVINHGPEPATNVTATDVLPGGLAFRQVSATSGGTCTHQSGIVDCSWPMIAAGAQAMATIVVVPQAVTTLHNLVVVSTPDQEDPNPDDNVSTLVTDVGEAAQQCSAVRMTQSASDVLPTHALHHAGREALLTDFSSQSSERNIFHYDTLQRVLGEQETEFEPSSEARIIAASDDLRVVLATVMTDVDTGAPLSEPVVLWMDLEEGRHEMIDGLLFEEETPERSVALSGDGESVLALRRSDLDIPEMVVIRPRNGDADLVASFASDPGSWPDRLLLSADASTAAFLGRQGPEDGEPSEDARVFLLDLALGNVQALSIEDRTIVPHALSAKGVRLVFSTHPTGDAAGGDDIRIFDVHEGERTIVSGGTLRSPALTRHGEAVVYLENLSTDGAEADWRLIRVDLVASNPLLEMERFGSHEPVLRSIDATGFRASLSGVASPLSLPEANDGGHAYLIDCFRPRQGLWWNDQRDGNGSDLSLSIEYALTKTWFTYEANGRPIWYIASAPLKGSSWQAELLRSTRNTDGSFTIEPVGHAYMAFENSHEAFFAWNLGETSRAEPWQFFEADPLSPVVDYTGLWFDPEEPGWGVSVYGFGARATGVVYFPGEDGGPRWVLGTTGPDDFGLFDVLQFHGPGLCPTVCDGPALTPTSVPSGSIRFTFDSRQRALLDVDIELANGLGDWLRTGREVHILTKPLP